MVESKATWLYLNFADSKESVDELRSLGQWEGEPVQLFHPNEKSEFI